MKNRSLIAIQFLLLLSMLSTQALGARKYAPNTSGTITATINACVGVTASSITFRYNICNTTFTGTSYGIAIAYAWYQNTTNTTTGGTLVSSGTGTCAAATSGSLTYVPSTATIGTTYYYCIITWTGTGACNTSGTLTSSAVSTVNVKSAPATIVGSSTLCTGATTTLTNTIAGGTWSSNSTGTATVGSTGIVTGVTNGPVTISYSTGCGTAASKTLTVSSTPTVNTTSGSSSVCAAATTNFTNVTTGGVWSSSNTGVATIGSTGTVTGVANGTSIISYTISNTCGSATSAKSLTVNAAPAAISGNSSICASATTTLTNTTMYGTWSSNNTSIVTVGSTTGIATGIANGTTTITYATGCGTNATKLITVSNSTITGTTSICSGTTTTLTDPITGGTWSSSNTAVATIGTSGLVNGVSTGTSIISYSNGVCPATATVSVKTTPSVISGITSLCSGTSTSLTNTASFGTWTSSNTSVATVNSWGTFAGVAQGTATITYSTGCGTAATKSVSVTNQPAAITGTTEFCATTTSTLANSVIGGTWSSSNTTVATVSGGVVTGVAAGTANITYAIGACYATTTVLIDPQPNEGSITGSTTLCDGATTTFSNSAAGGVWSISDSTIAVIDATGFVTSQNPGTAIISYQVTNVCGTATTTVTLNEIVIPSVSDISGLGQVCKGSSITLSDTTVEAVWSSSNTSVATIGSTGLVMGVNSGTAMISYTWTNACGTDFDTTMITVNPLPTSITGITNVCVGLTTTLGNSIAGGVWSINNGNATIGSTSALVTGVASGSSVVTYTLPTGCLNTTTVTVNSQPAAITGTTSLCVGASTTLYNTTSGGTWSISNVNATIGSATGIINGVIAGTAIVTYSLASGCKSTTTIIINALPVVTVSAGANPICQYSSTTLTASGGVTYTWVPTTGLSTTLGASISASPSSTTTYTVTGTNAASCSASAVITLSVTPLPTITTHTDGTSCGVGTVVLNATASTGSVNWYTVATGGSPVYTGTSYTTPVLSANTIYYAGATSAGCVTSTRTAVLAQIIHSVMTAPTTTPGANCGTGSVNLSATPANSHNTLNWYAASTGGTSLFTGNAFSTPVISSTTTYYVEVTDSGCVSATRYPVVATINSIPGITSTTGATRSGPGTLTLHATTTVGTISWFSALSGGSYLASDTSFTTPSIAGSTTYYVSATDSTTGCTTLIRSAVTANIDSIPSVDSTGAGVSCGVGTVTLYARTAGGLGTVNWYAGPTGGAVLHSGNTFTTPSISANTTYYAGAANYGHASLTRVPVVARVNYSTVTPPTVTNGSRCGTGTVAMSVVPFDSDNTVDWYTDSVGGSSFYTGTNYTSPSLSTTTTYYALISDSGCVAAHRVPVVATINTIPSITGVTDGSRCGTGIVVLGATASAGTVNWYTLSVGGTRIDTGAVFNTSSIPTSTAYYVDATNNTTGCTTASRQVVMASVNSLPTITASATPNPICENATLTLAGTASGGSGVYINYSWAGPGAFTSTGTFGSTSRSLVPTSGAGVYSVTVTDHNGCKSLPGTTSSVTVNAKPANVTVSASGTYCGNATLTAANGGSGTIYFHGLNSNDTSTLTAATSQVVFASGTYYFRAKSSAGCWSNDGSATDTINSLPTSIIGASNVCVGSTTTLSNATPSGAWTVSNANATINSATGAVSGITAGTVIVTYTLPTGCNTTSVLTINSVPAAITGTLSACIGTSVTLYDATPSGTWSVSNANASVGASTGVVTGLSVGTSIVSYTNASGCTATAIFTINAYSASITGATTVCVGSSTSLADSIAGGVWTVNNSNATIGSTSGLLTGVSAGTSVVTYTSGGGCMATAVVTINALPSAITGSTSVCVGSFTTLTGTGVSGIWSVSGSNASVGSASGIVTGISAGSALVAFTSNAGCVTTAVITVNSTPSAVTVSGTGYFCTATSVSATGGTGGTIYYQGIISGGTSTAIPSTSQSISSTGTYYFRSQSSAGCWSTEGSATITIPSITGFTTVCTGSTSALSDSARGGRWTSTNTSVAAIDSVSGVVSGVATGSSIITFVPYSGCTLNTTVTVITAPSAIVGATSVCRSSSITLTDATSGGAWYSSAPTIASINVSTGVVSGIASGYGAATITYYFGTRCSATTTITVNPYADITGSATAVCQGQSITLSDAVAGGVWSSSSASTATVGSSTGIVTGVAAGTTTISYRLSTGCTATYVVTVYPLSPISGPSSVCVGQTVALTDAVSGGTWRSTSPTIAIVALNTGIVTGAAAGYGTANIIYTTALGCMATQTMTVNALAVITGPTSVCQGQTMTLANGIAGGTWSSSASGIASINASTGVVSGIAAGNATISYTMPTGCTTTYDIVVNPLSTISGGTSVCVGFTTTLASAIAGGVWSSGSPTMATVGSSTGVVTGVAGLFTPTITYTLGTGCKSTIIVTVNALAAIGGAANICVNSPYTVTNAVAGGTWSSSNTSVATIGSTGLIREVSAGTTTITYSLPSGCATTKVMNVNPITPVMGATSICSGGTTTLNDATSGGTWASTAPGVATIGSLTGLVTGVMAGTSCFTYKVTATGCRSTLIMTIKAAPAAILGSSVVCAGSSSTYTDTVINGFWTSGNTSVATIGSTTGILTGIANGSATITYSTGCGTDATKVISVSNSGITGTLAVCTAATTNLTNASAGGTWVSNNTGIATIGSLNGTVTGVAGGTTIISYINGACTAVATVTVNIAPAAITGTANVCTGTSSSLANTTPYGNWSSSNTSIATINSATGLMTGVAAGTSIITYSTGCASVATKVATVTSLATSITGTSNVCTGLSTTLACSFSGGVWSGSNNAVLTVGSTTGFVTGIATGSAIVSYTIPSGCFLTAVLNVNSAPASITGLSSICVGQSTVLASTGTGSWSSSNSSIATVDTGSGIVTGITSGSAVITFTAATGCYTTTTININALPSTITGSSNICVGSSATLGSSGSGTWNSANTSIATINTTSGLVSGVASGTTTISYTLPTGCMIATIVTVNDLPASITGNVNVCSGASTTLSNTTTGGTWNSASVLVSATPTTGVITGVSAGTAIISYTLGTGCASIATINVKSIPSAITGSLNVCYGATTTLSDITSGTWSSSNVTTATIGSATGIVTGVYADTVSIIFTGSNGCATSALVTVNPLPSIIGGANNVCAGSSITLTNSGSGTWSSNNTAIATVGAASGIVTGLTAGTATITYTLPTGCSTSTVITVKALPSAITGTASTCVAGSTTLVETGGGTWSSSDYTVAYTNISSGVVTGISAGTATVTYMATNGCVSTTVFTVNPNPSAITGSSNVCQGATITLSNASVGIWSSENSTIATINSSTGVVTGIATGVTYLTFTLSTGCYTSSTINVNAIPSAISGSSTACVGMTTTMTDATASGTWSTSNTSVATINSVSGVLSGIAAGTTTVSYTTATGCAATQSVLVNAMPSTISGATSVCIGATATITSGAGGTWSSSNTANLTIGSATGIATGIAAGTATIIYTAGTGCQVSSVITVNSLPSSITGTANVCPGASSTLYNTSAGVWSTSNSSIATIGSLSGIVNGITAGTALVTYTIATGCVASQVVTVNPLPASITGATSVCQGLNATLTNSSIGGTWVSNNTSFASINSTSGVVTGVNPGSAVITYSLPTGCQITTNIAVNSLPAAITGNTSLTVGLTSTLTNTGTGTWSSANSLIASVNSAGVVTGVASGVTTITFTIASGCYATIAVDVNPVYPISGVSDICIGYTFTFSDATAGGNWSSSNTSIATIGSSTGIVTGIANGTATITYNVPSVGYRVYNVSIHSTPTPITGSSSVCVGQNLTLTESTPGGFWSTTSPTIATVGSSTGVVTGVAGGLTVNIVYTLGSGCSVTKTITVNQLGAISGPASVCAGQTISMTNPYAGGTWTSSSIGTTSIDASTGVVTGIVAGSATLSYVLPTGCAAYASVLVNALSPVVGPTSVCVGQSITLTDATSGGTWSSATPTIASIVANTGVVTGYAGPLSTAITYTLPNGCKSTYTVSVNPQATITGTATLCAGTITTLANTVTGGTWSSSNTAVATIGSAGVVTAIINGVTSITYSLPTGCYATTNVTVNALSAISGPSSVCLGQTVSLTNTVSGGVWSSSAPTVASIGSTGVVTGVAAGLAATVTYSLGTGCKATTTITVKALAAIAGVTSVCQGQTITLTNPNAGGTWSSNPTTVATVGTAGLVTGVSAGTVTISYALPSGCIAAAIVTVNQLSMITGLSSVCVGQTITLGNPISGGTWSTSAPTIATVGTIGVVTGIAAGYGTANITYTLGTGCKTFATIYVNPLAPVTASASSVCQGQTLALTDAIAGGTWASSSAAIATVGTSGIVTGVGTGATMITYTLATGCNSTYTVSVNQLAPITGSSTACLGQTLTLSNSIAGGTWSSSAPTIATVAASTGVVTGIAAGLTANITYALSNGCRATLPITVSALPTVAAITGASTVSVSGSTITLADATTGGLWSSANAVIATIGSTGIVSGRSVGSVAISYTVTNAGGCSSVATKTLTVGPAPIQHTYTTGSTITVNVGATVRISENVTVGTWSASNDEIATVNNENGEVKGITEGRAMVTYTSADGTNSTLYAVVVNVENIHTQSNQASTTEPTATPVVTAMVSDLIVFPNPNKGEFNIKGSVAINENESVTVEITNMLGQVVLSNQIDAKGANVNEHIVLGNNLVNGMYLITIRSGNLSSVMHMVIEQ